jgi:type II secretory pathway pseudopilin PulG
MMSSSARHDGESGFVLLAAIVLLVLLLISLAIAAPKVAQSIQRDKELEAIHRGEQYRLAIKLYYQKFGAYPTSVKQLLNTNNLRFLRQEYTDPLTGKDDWKPVLFGQAHVRPLGFFGKPLSAVGGIAASGVMGGGMTPGMYAIEPSSTDANGNPTDSNNGTSSTTESAANNSAGTTAGSFGSSNSSLGGGMFSSGQSGFGSSFGSSSGGFGSTSSGFGSSASPSPTTGAGSTMGSGFGGTSATTFGGNGVGPIVGFTLPIRKPSLIDYMEQTAYNKWEFNYDPAADMLQQAVSLLGGGATMNNSTSATTANSFGFGSNSSSNGAGSIFGSSNSGASNGNSGTQNGTNPPTTNPQPQNPDNPQQ